MVIEPSNPLTLIPLIGLSQASPLDSVVVCTVILILGKNYEHAEKILE